MKQYVNGYVPVQAFGSFGGKAMGTLDAIHNLNNQDKHDLWRIMSRISENANIISNDEAQPEDIRKDARAVCAAFAHAASEFLLA